MITLPKKPPRHVNAAPTQRTRATWRAELRRRNAEFGRLNAAIAQRLTGAFK